MKLEGLNCYFASVFSIRKKNDLQTRKGRTNKGIKSWDKWRDSKRALSYCNEFTLPGLDWLPPWGQKELGFGLWLISRIGLPLLCLCCHSPAQSLVISVPGYFNSFLSSPPGPRLSSLRWILQNELSKKHIHGHVPFFLKIPLVSLFPPGYMS